MRRAIALSVLILVGLVSVLATAQERNPALKMLQVTRLKDNLYVLKGGGANTAVFIMSDGVTVVDSKNPGWGQSVLNQVKALTSKPVVRIINTHMHGDHVGGNVEFPVTVDIVAHADTKTNMKLVSKDSGERGMPTQTFKERMTIGRGNDRIELYYFGRAHTNGDAWVLFPALRVMHTGDALPGRNFPALDAIHGGSGVAFPDTLQKVYDTVTNVDTIVTGHSDELTRDDLKQYIAFNREFLDYVRDAKKAGKSIDDVVSDWKLPEKYVRYAPPRPERLKANVQVIYDELK